MEISPENDEVFGFDQYVPKDYSESAVNVREYTAAPKHIVVEGLDKRKGADDLPFYFVLSLDDAEEVAYRILYAVNKLREENPDG